MIVLTFLDPNFFLKKNNRLFSKHSFKVNHITILKLTSNSKCYKNFFLHFRIIFSISTISLFFCRKCLCWGTFATPSLPEIFFFSFTLSCLRFYSVAINCHETEQERNRKEFLISAGRLSRLDAAAGVLWSVVRGEHGAARLVNFWIFFLIMFFILNFD